MSSWFTPAGPPVPPGSATGSGIPAPGSIVTSGGGGASRSVAVAAGASAVVKAAPGTLAVVTVTIAGTSALPFYDNASAASGAVLGTIPASAAAGSTFQFNMPAANGIYAGGVAGTPAVTVGYA